MINQTVDQDWPGCFYLILTPANVIPLNEFQRYVNNFFNYDPDKGEIFEIGVSYYKICMNILNFLQEAYFGFFSALNLYDGRKSLC